MDDDISRPLTVDDNYLLMTGNGLPGAAGDPDFFCPDRGHDVSLSRIPYGTVRKRTEVATWVPHRDDLYSFLATSGPVMRAS
ncbi:MAG: hypothetical protein ACRDNF_13205, partial [Streptosporangiaceae bacterium]